MRFPDFTNVDADVDIIRCAQTLETVLVGKKYLHRRDFNPKQFKWMLGRIFIVDVLAEESDYQFKLFGSRMAQVYGVDLTGQKLSMVRAASFESALRVDFDQVIASGDAHFRTGTLLWPNREFVRVQRLLTPLADDSGRAVAILGAVAYSSNLRSMLLVASQAAYQNDG